MAAIAIFAVACAIGALFLLRFLVAICGEDDRGNHVVHMLRAWPEHDGRGGNEPKQGQASATEDVSLDAPHRRMAPVYGAKLTTRRESGGTRKLTAMQRANSPVRGRTRKTGKGTR
jgi:hypothetical protein